MKGGPSIEVLLDLALGRSMTASTPAAKVVKNQVFLYDADTARLEAALKRAMPLLKIFLESYAKLSFSLTYLK